MIKMIAMNLKEEIKKLSDAEKILLVEEIWDDIATHSKSNELSDAKKKEIDRRMADIKNGKAVFSSWDEVKAKAQKLVNGI